VKDFTPSESQAEAGALACVLNASPDQARLLFAQIDEADCFDERHMFIFRALSKAEADNQPLNVISLVQYLKDDGETDRAGGLDYIQRLPDQTPSVENFPQYLDTIKDRTQRRRMLDEAQKLQDAARNLSVPVTEQKTKSALPAITDAADFVAADIREPQQIIEGILHRGCKMAIGVGSKTFKSWSLIDLSLSVSHRETWLSMPTSRARVCYVNLELPVWSIHSRIRVIAHEKRITIQPGWLQVWNLRGHAVSYQELLPKLSNELKKGDFGLLVLDPTYKLLGSADENSARDINAMLNGLESLAQATGAAVVFASHFSKGNQAAKDAVDRISGSGVFARDPDAILTFTKHETGGAFVVDSTLRNCKVIEPFVARWHYPLMRRDDALDPTKLKQPAKGGRVSSFAPELLFKHLPKKKATTSAWQKKVCEETGMSRSQFYTLFKQVESQVERNKIGQWNLKNKEVQNSPKTPC
jgi:hypothetical protein